MENLTEKVSERKTGEMEVVTVRTPSNGYTHHVILSGIIEVSKAEIEEAQRKNIQLYEQEMKRLSGTSAVVENVRTLVYYTEKLKPTRRELTYPMLTEQGDILALRR